MDSQDRRRGRWDSIRRVLDIDRWQEIWQAISQNRTRSVLTGFGIFWGMFMLVLMVGMGNGLKSGVSKEIDNSVSVNSLFVGSAPTSEAYKGFKKGRSWRLDYRDIALLQDRVAGIEHISPVLFYDSNAVRGKKSVNANSKGVMPLYNKIEVITMKKGRFINDMDVEGYRKVCVIGSRIYEELFEKGEDAIGQYIKYSGMYFQVVGVAEEKGNSLSVNGTIDRGVLLPISTMQRAFHFGQFIDIIALTADKDVNLESMQNEVKSTLAEVYHISPTDEKAFFVLNFAELFRMFFTIGLSIMVLVWIVGMGTLAAGGIGVSNIMLVTVRERTKEIGIKRAIGATPFNIIGQIMTESLILTLIAGTMGIVLGVGVLQLVDMALSNSDMGIAGAQISFTVAVGALIIIAFIGVLAGLMPAKRAMSIKAIDAIRAEN